MAGPAPRGVVCPSNLFWSGILCVVAQSSCCFSVACLGLSAHALAVAPNLGPSPPATQAQVAALTQAIHDAQTSGDNAWVLVSAALVLLMTAPGLTLFYGGLVRRKNILGTMMQSFAMMGLITVLWAVVGYSLAFGAGNGFIGGLEHAFLRGVSLAPNPNYGGTIPEQSFMIYQLMFAIITPALITGAFAERVKFSAMAVFLCLWSLVVYCPMAHMIWGVGGILNYANPAARWPVFDFAGGTVVHITSGVSALVCALYLGKRVGYPQEDMPPHSMVLSFIGAGMLWVGWFGFNAGSALDAGPLGHQRLCQYPIRRRRRRHHLGHRRVAAKRQAHRAGRNLRRGRRIGHHHPGLRLCPAHVGAGSSAASPASSAASWSSGSKSSSATTTRSTPLAFTASAAPWALCSPASLPPAPSTPSSAKTPLAFPTLPEPSTATGIRSSISWSAWASAGRWPSSALWPCSSSSIKPWACASPPPKKPQGLDLSQHGEEGYELNA